MTSEILIMNKEAIAIAADSAASLNDVKIFKAHKIFTLSKYAPVAIMIYGNSAFNNIPWETVIKEFRKRLGNQKFDTLTEYSEEFLKFLSSNNGLLTSEDDDYILSTHLVGYYQYIANLINKKIENHIAVSEKKQITEEEVMVLFSEIICSQVIMWKRANFHPNQDQNSIDNFIQKYHKEIDKSFDAKFEKIAQIIRTNKKYSTLYDDMLMIAASNFLKISDDIQIPGMSGIVIAGFGEKEKFPSYTNHLVWLKIDNYLKFLHGQIQTISHHNSANIKPFAQGEMVDLFMAGIDPTYQQVINSTIADFLQKYPESIVDMIQCNDEKEKERILLLLKAKNEEIYKDFIQKTTDYKQQKQIQPILTVVTNLPRDELAGMAESLISLTSFKKRVTMQAENVGGPIDVAVITKGDGFIWIKRKHYFKPELNPQFFANYYGNERYSQNGDSK